MEAEVYALATALDDYRARQTLLLERERDFSGHLSHELRTPLSVVRGQAELMARQYPQDSNLQQRTADITAQVERMRLMIEQLLRLARRTLAPRREDVPLRPLVERIWRDLAHDSSSRTQLANQLSESVTIKADPLLLELILRNALANARLHADGAELRVSFDSHELCIEDFNPERLSSPLPDNEGSEGLGLSILRRACGLLGWSCDLQELPTGLRLSIGIA
jgi:signal transduction histidine kinase